jgi:hypothetical protein
MGDPPDPNRRRQLLPRFFENRRLYERHGFETVGVLAPAGGPPLWPMWRHPATSGTGKHCALWDETSSSAAGTLATRQANQEVVVYDYIVVGAGSAGCVLAARLTEDPDSRVLLEAGPPDEAAEIRVPAATPTLWQGPLSRPGAGPGRRPDRAVRPSH